MLSVFHDSLTRRGGKRPGKTAFNSYKYRFLVCAVPSSCFRLSLPVRGRRFTARLKGKPDQFADLPQFLASDALYRPVIVAHGAHHLSFAIPACVHTHRVIFSQVGGNPGHVRPVKNIHRYVRPRFPSHGHIISPLSSPKIHKRRLWFLWVFPVFYAGKHDYVKFAPSRFSTEKDLPFFHCL